MKSNLRKKTSSQALPLWNHDAEFQVVYQRIRKKFTVVSADRCYVIWKTCKHLEAIDGDAAELGVYKGGTAFLIGNALLSKKIHLFDTFKGLPETNAVLDLHATGDFGDVNLQSVKELLLDPKYLFYEGHFPATAKSLNSKFCFVHLDADLFQSTYDALIRFWPLLTSGGIIIGDDYGWSFCPGVKLAFDRFSEESGTQVIYFPNGQCMLIKR